MNTTIYNILIVILYILFALSLFLIPYSIIKLTRRRKSSIYIAKNFTFFGYFCLVVFYIIFIDAIHIDGINHESNNIVFLVCTMLLMSILGNLLLWMCAHYAVQILEDRIVYKKLFVGKIVIKIEDLDIKNSRYYFVKGKGKRDFGHEILFLKKKDGAEYKIRIEDILQDGYNNDFISAIIFKLKLKREDYCKN